MDRKFLHWVKGKLHVCIKCGGNLLSPYTTSVCPVESKKKCRRSE
jgi:hypothetical protein